MPVRIARLIFYYYSENNKTTFAKNYILFSQDFHQIAAVLGRKIQGEKISNDELLSLNQKLVKKHRCNVYLKPEKEALTDQINRINKNFLLKQLKISAESIQLQKLAQQNNVRLLFPKGIVLDELLFEGKKERISRDVDFLIDSKDIAKMHSLLIEQGFGRIFPEFELSSPQLQGASKVLNQFAYFHPRKKVTVELHWRLFRNKKIFDVPFDELWKNKSSIKVDNNTLFYLSEDTLALFLIVHASLHGWERIFWLVDIALLFQKYSKEDWISLKEKAIQHKLIKPVQQTFFLLEKWLGIKFDSGFKPAIEKDIEYNYLKKFVIDLDHYIYTKEPQDNQKDYIFYAAKMISKQRVYPFHLFNHSVLDFKTIPLPKQIYWLYPFMHPVTALIRKATNKG